MYRDNDQREFARALRNQPTDAERRLWHFLSAQKLRGRKYRRLAAIGPYVVDFVCFADKLFVELDGPQHLDPEAVELDQWRTNWLTTRGFRVVRFRNQELDENIRAVVDAIGRAIDELEARAEAPLPSPPRRGEGAGREIGSAAFGTAKRSVLRQRGLPAPCSTLDSRPFLAESISYSNATRGNIELKVLANGKPVESGTK